ncbi:aminopeptidase P family protein [Candidatus Daviesbacteria bacterium]|nr:aminopeptidase P family protein [Candidatus Daviesbacteria bacterium]
MFQQRINNLRQKFLKEKLDAVLISSVSNITYLTGFTNFSEKEREAYIFIGKKFAYIITDARYTEAVKKEVLHLTLFERGGKKSTEDLLKKHKSQVKKLGIEEDNLTVAEHKIIRKHFKNTKHFDVNHLRSIKTEEEISKIEKACKIGDLAFEYILKKIKAGLTEKEIAGELEDFIRSKGAAISFPPIVAFGENSAVPHHQTGPSTLFVRSGQKGQIVLFDFGVKYENYCSDMTRTVFFGKPGKKQKDIYETVLKAQQEAIEYINGVLKSGKAVKAAKADKAARDYITSKGYKSIPHSLGHGIGLDVHEHPSLSPKSKEILKEGMVFSIEPGIYLPEAGGVRIEDLFVLEKKGLRQLTHSPNKLIAV